MVEVEQEIVHQQMEEPEAVLQEIVQVAAADLKVQAAAEVTPEDSVRAVIVTETAAAAAAAGSAVELDMVIMEAEAVLVTSVV